MAQENPEQKPKPSEPLPVPDWEEISPIVTPQEIEAIKQTSSFLGVKTTLIRDPKTQIRYAVPVALSPNPTVDRIINYSQRTSYVGIINESRYII